MLLTEPEPAPAQHWWGGVAEVTKGGDDVTQIKNK